jgi:NAD(P)H dehydrogenase (quinone)
MNFNPVASAKDFRLRQREDYLVYALEQRHGLETRTLAADIQAEIDKVVAADLLILNFPLYWMSMPAILKGWIDRVFVSGLFYGGKRIYGQGGMVGKKALVSITLGGREYMFGDGALHGPLYGPAGMLRPLLQGTLGYAGMEVLEPFIAYHVPYIDAAARQELIDLWQTCLGRLDDRPALAMPNLTEYDDTFHLLANLRE